MQSVTVKHGERRSALNIDVTLRLLAATPEAQQLEPPLGAAVLQPTLERQLGPITGPVVLEVLAIEQSEDGKATADVACIVRNDGPEAITLESIGGRYRGTKQILSAGDERMYALNPSDGIESIEVRMVPVVLDTSKLERLEPGQCDRRPCDRIDGNCPRCDVKLPSERVADQVLQDTGPQN